MLVFSSNGQTVTVPYVDGDGKQYPPNLERVWTADELAGIGLQILAVSPQPAFNPSTQVCTQNAQPTLRNGV